MAAGSGNGFHSGNFAALGGAQLQEQVLALLRGRVAHIMVGTIFLFGGLAVCGIALMRRRSGARALLWLGIWSAMYGAKPLGDALAAVAVLPMWIRAGIPYLDIAIDYLILVVAALAFLELSLGKLRTFLKVVIFVGLAIAMAGIGFFLFSGTPNQLITYNQLLATCSLLVLLTIITVPRLSRKYLMIADRRVLAAGTLVFTMEALYANLARPFGYGASWIFDMAGFAVLLLSFGYVALQVMFGNERRLLSIESELVIAREIQTSILPSSTPAINNLRITTAYRPMTAVAGDFYEFIVIDENRIGILVADVSGHGVPAALIAAMIKVAVQTVVPCAENPGALLHELNRILCGQLYDQFVTAAYLLIDTQNRTARYSAAGHPPLLRSRGGRLERIESNGIVFGVAAEPVYPVCDMLINPGDRFLLYTDGVIEPENARGESFGDGKLEEVVRENQSRPPSGLVDELLFQIGRWQPAALAQQDDITLLVIDVI